ncbi:MAG: J domain-containing protein [Holosporales bacterium]
MPNAVNLDEKEKWVRGTVLPEESSTSTKQQEPLPKQHYEVKNKAKKLKEPLKGRLLPEEPSTSTKQQEPSHQEPEVKKNKTPYEILGVAKNATPEEIKKAFREQAKQCNVDKYSTELSDEKKKAADAKLYELSIAYKELDNRQQSLEEERKKEIEQQQYHNTSSAENSSSKKTQRSPASQLPGDVSQQQSPEPTRPMLTGAPTSSELALYNKDPVEKEKQPITTQFSRKTALVSAGMAVAGTMEFLRQQNLAEIAGKFGGKAAEHMTSLNHYHRIEGAAKGLSNSEINAAIEQWGANAQAVGFHGNANTLGDNIAHFANQGDVGHACAALGAAATIHALVGLAKDVHKMATGKEKVTAGKVIDMTLKAAQVGVGAATHVGAVNPATGAVIAAGRLGLHLAQEETLNKAKQLKETIQENRANGGFNPLQKALSSMNLVRATAYYEAAERANGLRNALGNGIEALRSKFTPEQEQTVQKGIEAANAMIAGALPAAKEAPVAGFLPEAKAPVVAAQAEDLVAPELLALPAAMRTALKESTLPPETAQQLQAGGAIVPYSTHKDAPVVAEAIQVLQQGHELSQQRSQAGVNQIVNFKRDAVNA